MQDAGVATTILSAFMADPSAAKRKCVAEYGDRIWCIAKSVTPSEAEAEALTIDIFDSIWRYAKEYERTHLCEEDFVETIAAFRLARYRRSRTENGRPSVAAA